VPLPERAPVGRYDAHGRAAQRPGLDRRVYHAYEALYWGFIVVPIVAGADKFLHLLTDWVDYLAPVIPRMFGVEPATVMLVVGVAEIAAGLLVAFKPGIGGLLVGLWLWAIVANLVVLGAYYDVALRDAALSLAALALSRLARYVDETEDLEISGV
jgi:hypothetical protein